MQRAGEHERTENRTARKDRGSTNIQMTGEHLRTVMVWKTEARRVWKSRQQYSIREPIAVEQ
jgi:hypothetical protein